MTIRVVVVDDHPFYREGVKSMVPLIDSGIEIVGEAGSAAEAITVVHSTAPDVVLMDLAMPGMTGVEATRALKKTHPSLAVLVLTMLDDDSVFAALAAGANGYLLKDASMDDVCRAIRSVANGEVLVAGAIAGRVLSRLARTRGAGVFPDLTTREHEVLDRIARGQSTAQIARELFLSAKTVRNYISVILAKLGVSTRDAAAAVARAAGLGLP